MNKLLTGLAAVPLMSSVAFAGQVLSDRQMDAITAGAGVFSAFSSSEAEAYGGVTTSATTNLAEVAALRGASGPVVLSYNDVTLNIIKSVSAASSISTAANLPALETP